MLLTDLALPDGAALPAGSRGVIIAFVPKQVSAPSAS